MAPEVIKREEYDYSCDWWSYGVLAYVLLCGELPYQDEDKTKLYDSIIYKSHKFQQKFDTDTQDFLSKFFR